MAGLQNNRGRGRKRRAVAVGFKLLTAAPTILPTPYPTTPTTSYYSLPTLWPAFRIIVDVDESATPWPWTKAQRPGETSNDQIRPVTSATPPSLAQARKKRTLGCVYGCREDVGLFGAGFVCYSSPTRASLGLGTYALRPQRDIATGNGRLVKLYPRVSSASRRLFFVAI